MEFLTWQYLIFELPMVSAVFMSCFWLSVWWRAAPAGMWIWMWMPIWTPILMPTWMWMPTIDLDVDADLDGMSMPIWTLIQTSMPVMI